MVGVKIFARLEADTVSTFANTRIPKHFPRLANMPPEICARAADVVDIALKAGHLRELRRFGKYRLVAAGNNLSALMGVEGAECAVPETPAVAYKAEFNFLD